MHITGKILIWLLLILWGVALYLSVGVVKIRSAWLDKIQKTQGQIDELNKNIAEMRSLRLTRESELTRELAPWGAYWTGVKATLNQQTGQFQVGMMDANGTPVKLVENQLVHLFTPSADGKTSNYLGHFKVEGVQPQASTLKPTVTLRVQDPLSRPDLAEAFGVAKAEMNRASSFDNLAAWNAPVVRIRSDVPSAYTNKILEAEMELIRSDERVAAAGLGYQAQLVLLETAKKLITDHTAAIAGPGTPDKNVPLQFKVGYLKAIEEEAAARDDALYAVDVLRHQLKAATDEFSQLKGQIQKMEQVLPKGVTPAQTASRR